jgi:protoporphyrinogen oxidase
MDQPGPQIPDASDRTGGHAVILGGGITGLAAALRLTEAGRWSPRILERESEPGGLARSLRFKGVSTDLGPHRIHTEIPEVARLIEDVAAPSLMTVQRKSHIYLNGRFLTYPPAPLEMALRMGPLRMARFMAGFGWEKVRPAPREETYESLMRRAFGGPLYNYLIRPYSEKTWKTDPAALHADTARVRVSAGSLGKMILRLLRREQAGSETALKQFRYVRGGIQTLVTHLWERARAGGARLELNAEIEGLELDREGRVLAARLSGAHGSLAPPGRVPGDMFLSTLPLPVLLDRLLPPREELADARDAARGLTYLDMIFVCLIARRKIISGDNWLYFPEPHLVFNRAYEAKSMDPALGPADKSALCVEITLRPGDAIGRASDAELIGQVSTQIADTGLLRADEIEDAFVYRISYAYPIYTLDYDRRLDRVFAGLRRIPNLMTAGRQGLFNHNNMDHSIFMGLQAADALNTLAPDRAVQSWYDRVGQFKHMRIVD